MAGEEQPAPAPAKPDQPKPRTRPNGPSESRPNVVGEPREIIQPLYTGHALDNALRDLNAKFIAPEGVGKVRGGILPLVTAIGAEASLGGVKGAVLDTLGAAAGASAITTLIFSPIVSLVRRTAFGESAMRQAARYMLKNGGGNGLRGAVTALVTGLENKALRGVYFKENATRQKLLKIAEDISKDKNLKIEYLSLGDDHHIQDMIAEGMLAGSQAQALVDLGIPLSKVETLKLKNMVRMHETARKIFDAKATTPGRQEELQYDILPKLVEGKERAMWVKNSAWLAAIGAGKSVAFAGALHVISLENIGKLAGGLGNVLRGAGEAVGKVLEPILNLIRQLLGSLGGTAAQVGEWSPWGDLANWAGKPEVLGGFLKGEYPKWFIGMREFIGSLQNIFKNGLPIPGKP